MRNILLCKLLHKKLFYLLSLFISVNVFAQNVTISKRNATLAELFDEIEAQTELSIAYSESTVDKNRKVTVEFKDMPVGDAMRYMLQGTGATYSINGKMILIKPTSVAQAGEKKTIKGTVTDEKGEPIIGANVVVKGTDNGTITDVDGNFTLQAAENAVLQISYIGYIANEIAVKKRTQLNVVLREDAQALEEVVVVG